MRNNKLTEAIETAKSSPKANQGWEKIVWGNKHSTRARKIIYGFNYQKIGKFKTGDIVENAWSGNHDQAFGNVCEVMEII